MKQKVRPIFVTVFLIFVTGPLLFGQKNNIIDKSGIYFGVNIGSWVPVGQNQVLGNPLFLGLSLDLKIKKNSWSFCYDGTVLDSKTRTPIHLKYEDTLYTSNKYSVALISLEYSRQLWETRRISFEAIVGVGYGNLIFYDPPNSDIYVAQASFIFNPGLNIRYLIGKKLFMQLKIQYHIANYDLRDHISTNLKGNYIMTKLVIGGR